MKSPRSSPTAPGASLPRSEWLLALVGAALTTTYFFTVWKLGTGKGFTAFDTYQHFYANMLYAVSALRDGARGLLWNPYQSCGSPFLGTSSNGIAYPGNLFFLVLDPDRALIALIVVNMTLAGGFAYALCRELGARPLAAGCGALAFQLGNGAIDMTTWSPMVGGPYVWLPGALLFCERLLRGATLGNAIGLAVVLSLGLLPGYPQVVVFTYQLILLRVVWQLLSRRLMHPGRTLLLVAVGLVLPPLLTAVQLLPGIELARVSMRGRALSGVEVLGAGALTWESFQRAFSWHRDLHNPFLLLPTLIVVNGLLDGATRRAALFYFTATILYLLLAVGPATPLYSLYVSLPTGALFRDPSRFLWVTSFCLAILVALGVEALGRRDHPSSVLGAVAAGAAPLAILLGLSLVPYKGLLRQEWTLGIAVVAAAFLCGLVPRWRTGFAFIVALLVAYNLVAFPIVSRAGTYLTIGLRGLPGRSLLPDGSVMRTHAELFDELRARMTAQDRMYLVHGHPTYVFYPKIASVFQLPSPQNYEPQPTQRAAEYNVMLRTGRIMEDINEFYIPMSGQLPASLRRRLLDLTAARYIVAEASVDTTVKVLRPPPPLVLERGGLRVYENTKALPRAFYVPRIEVLPGAEALLNRLARGMDDLRQVALVEEAPASGFTGTAPYDGRGTVAFVTNEPEHLVLDVHASQPGFLFLSDHHFPGWQATVNGKPTVIQNANFLFRLVEVPAGDARVELRYRPASVRVGAAVSALTAICLLAVGYRRRRRVTRRRRPAPITSAAEPAREWPAIARRR